MPTTSEMLEWTTLTGMINDIKTPNQFLKRLLYSTEQTLGTETIEISSVHKDRETAPFVARDGEAILVSGHTEKFQNVTAPNIRIKRPFTPSELLFNRRPGTAIMVNPEDQQTAIVDHIARDLRIMENMIVNTEELMVSQALRGTVSYQAADQAVFQISFNRDSQCDITLTSAEAWDATDPSGVRVHSNIMTVKRVMSDLVGLNPTDAICGRNASDALMELAESGNLKAIKTDSNVRAGTMTFVEQFTEDGVIFLGELSGVRFWEYSRTVSHQGSATSMIRSDYVEFVSTSEASERVMYYAAIPDMDSLESSLPVQTKRFSKSWSEKDPSRLMSLAASRPLTVPRRPNATVSMKVTNI